MELLFLRGKESIFLQIFACHTLTETPEHWKLCFVQYNTHSSSVFFQDECVLSDHLTTLWLVKFCGTAWLSGLRAILMNKVFLRGVCASRSLTARNHTDSCLGCRVARPIHNRGVLENNETPVIRLW